MKRKLKWKVSFAALLIVTAVFIAFAYVVAAAEQEKPILVSGVYAKIKAVDLDSPPENRWFLITSVCCIDVDSPDTLFEGLHASILWGSLLLAAGWIVWITLFVKASQKTLGESP